MTEATDFIALYSELRIAPECSPEEFKRAYRKRVSELHPDRTGGGEDALKALNLGYAAAQEFHRVHGRFPGASPPRPSSTTINARATGRITAVPERPVVHEQEARGHHHQHSRWLSLVLLVLLAIFAIAQFTRSNEQEIETRPDTLAGMPVAKASPPSLLIGMPQRQVVEEIGRPLEVSADGLQWLYGPSWIRFACNAVADWYSSPLKPLGLSSSKPGPGDVVAGHEPGKHCQSVPLRTHASPAGDH